MIKRRLIDVRSKEGEALRDKRRDELERFTFS